MMLAAHLPVAVSVPLGGCCLLAIAWYWRRLGGPAVPGSRRLVRRLSLALMGGLLVLFVVGLSFVDPQRSAGCYLVVWSSATVGVFLVMAVAVVDMMNTLRLHRQLQRWAYLQAAQELIEAARGGTDGEAS